MGIFDRVRNVWKGKVSDSLSQMENRNPEAVYESAIAERENSFKELKQATAGLVSLRDKDREELGQAERDLTRILPAIEVAMGEGDEDTALILLQQKDALESRVEELRAEIANLDTRADAAKEGLRAFRGEIDKLRREKDEMLARKASAEARIQTQETLSGISADADVKALANVRANIEQMHSDANEGLLDADGNSVRARVDQARTRMAESSARSQLEELKRQMRGESAPSAAAPAPAAEAPDEGAAPEDAPAADEPPKRSL